MLAFASPVVKAAQQNNADGQQRTPDRDGQAEPKDGSADDQKNDSKAKNDQKLNEPVDETKITRKDAEGREYRECPQCGSNMYRQDRTWTCENCGYSYTE